MSPFRLAKCLALSAAVFCGLAAAAQAQGVLAVDINRVLAESQVGQYVQGQIGSIGQTIQTELQTTASGIQTDAQRLQAEAQSLTPEAIAANADLMSRQDALNARIGAFQNQQAQAQADMQATEQAALDPILAALSTILESVRAERSASVILNTSAAVAVDPSVDISSDVIARLNAQMTTSTVTRVNTSQAAPAQ